MYWLKCSKAVPQKTKFGPKYKWFKSKNLKFGVPLKKVLFQGYNGFIFTCPDVPVDISEIFL